MGISPYLICTKFCLGRASQNYTSTPNLTIVALKVWPCGPKKSPKMVIFGKNLSLEKKFWGSIGKLEHRCTTTNLSLCNDTIIVLTITVLNSVSVITRFVMSFESVTNKKNTKNITLFGLQPARDPQSPPYLA